jgi:hypothetical protein
MEIFLIIHQQNVRMWGIILPGRISKFLEQCNEHIQQAKDHIPSRQGVRNTIRRRYRIVWIQHQKEQD